MSYEFKDFGQTAVNNPLSIRSIVSGKTLDFLYRNDGFMFTTLTVEGRGVTKYDVDATVVYGRDGAVQRNRQLQPRTIIVRALVSSYSNEKYREGMSKLNAYLYANVIHSLKFTDDVAHTYYGTCIRVEDQGETSNKQVIEIEFVCNDPYKYTDPMSYTITSASPMQLNTDVPIIADSITVHGSSAFTLMNTATKHQIVFSGTGSPIQIRQKQDFIGTPNGSSQMKGLNITYSDFDQLRVHNGQVLWASPAPSSIVINYRGAKL